MNPWTILILVGAVSGAVFAAIMIRGWYDGRSDKDNRIDDLKKKSHAKNH